MLSHKLAERMGGIHIDLSELAEMRGIISGYDESRGTSIVDLELMEQELADLLEDGDGLLIIDGHFAPEVVPPRAVTLAFVLRRAPWILKDELTARGFSEKKVRENVEAELLDVCLVDAIDSLGRERVCEVDTTGKTPGEVLDEVVSIIRGERPCCSGLIDWLGRDESRGLLEA